MGAVPRPVADPRLGLARRERDRDERGAQVVRPQALPALGALVQLRTAHPDPPEVTAQLLGQVLDVHGHALFGKHVVARLRVRLAHVLPTAQRLDRIGPQVPVARIIGLVFVQVDAAPFEIHFAPPQPRHLVGAHALAHQEAIRKTPQDRNVVLVGLDRSAGEKARVLVREEALLGLGVAHARQPAAGDRASGDPLSRVDGQPHDPRDDLRDVASGRRRKTPRQAGHDRFRMLEREVGQTNVFRDGQDVEPQKLAVAVRGPLLLDVIGVLLVQGSVRPLFGEDLERRRHGGRRACRRPRGDGFGGVASRPQSLVRSRLARDLQQLGDLLRAGCAPQALGEIRQQGPALLGRRLVARRDRKRAPALGAGPDPDPCTVAVRILQNLAGCVARHGYPRGEERVVSAG
ncbi:MAG: hypothetical protein ABSF69_27775 [Polyangiaceae bacterium]